MKAPSLGSDQQPHSTHRDPRSFTSRPESLIPSIQSCPVVGGATRIFRRVPPPLARLRRRPGDVGDVPQRELTANRLTPTAAAESDIATFSDYAMRGVTLCPLLGHGTRSIARVQATPGKQGTGRFRFISCRDTPAPPGGGDCRLRMAPGRVEERWTPCTRLATARSVMTSRCAAMAALERPSAIRPRAPHVCAARLRAMTASLSVLRANRRATTSGSMQFPRRRPGVSRRRTGRCPRPGLSTGSRHRRCRRPSVRGRRAARRTETAPIWAVRAPPSAPTELPVVLRR